MFHVAIVDHQLLQPRRGDHCQSAGRPLRSQRRKKPSKAPGDHESRPRLRLQWLRQYHEDFTWTLNSATGRLEAIVSFATFSYLDLLNVWSAHVRYVTQNWIARAWYFGRRDAKIENVAAVFLVLTLNKSGANLERLWYTVLPTHFTPLPFYYHPHTITPSPSHYHTITLSHPHHCNITIHSMSACL